MPEMPPVRVLETFDTKEEANEQLDRYAANLRKMRATRAFGVKVEYRPGAGWCICLVQRHGDIPK